MLSEAGVRLLMVGCFAYAGGMGCTKWSCLEFTNTTAWEHLKGTFLVYYPIFFVCRDACCSWKALPLWTLQPKLTATSDLQAVGGTEADLTPYCIHSPTTNRCYWSVKAHQRPRRHVVSTSGQSYPLQSYLCSASRVSLQPSLTCPCLHWSASCLPGWTVAG